MNYDRDRFYDCSYDTVNTGITTFTTIETVTGTLSQIDIKIPTTTETLSRIERMAGMIEILGYEYRSH